MSGAPFIYLRFSWSLILGLYTPHVLTASEADTGGLRGVERVKTWMDGLKVGGQDVKRGTPERKRSSRVKRRVHRLVGSVP